jgi:type IV fimbrial biogenesis protein FimT
VLIPRTPPAGLARGVSLIELMIGISILAVALMFGVPSFGEWIQNTRIRSMAESLQNGIQFARAEAVRRNSPTQFQFVTTTDSSCVLSTAGPYWVVNLPTATAASPTGACGAAVSDTTAPYILQLSPVVSSTSAKSTMLSATRTVISFDGLGRQTAAVNPARAAAALSVDITPPATSSCLVNGGSLRCLRVTVTLMGQTRMCDPAAAGTSAAAC